MGLKDMFGGGKKKAEVREKAKEIVGTGKLTRQAISEEAHEDEGTSPGDERHAAQGSQQAVGAANGSKLQRARRRARQVQKFSSFATTRVERPSGT